jgi:hypothetical protein
MSPSVVRGEINNDAIQRDVRVQMLAAKALETVVRASAFEVRTNQSTCYLCISFADASFCFISTPRHMLSPRFAGNEILEEWNHSTILIKSRKDAG